MAQAAAQNKEYFLGIGGEQQGPFSEQDILARIQTQGIPPDALVWYEGLDSWLPVNSIPIFRDAFHSVSANAPVNAPLPEAPPPPPGAMRARPAPSAPLDDIDDPNLPPSSFAGSDVPMDTVFGKSEARISKLQPWETRSGAYGIILLGVGAFLALLYVAFSSPDSPLGNNQAQQKVPPKVTRDSQLRVAMSELIIKSKESLETLENLIAENPTDEVGVKAIDAAVDYYRRNRRHVEAGNILMKAKRPAEAAPFFLKDPPNYSSAAQAYFEAYQQGATADLKAQSLLENVGLLLGPLAQRELAVERLRTFETEFPGRPHPYKYYLKPDAEKIEDIFSRLTGYFAELLDKQIQIQFPEIRLQEKASVELLRGPGGEFRIVAKYVGPAILNRDKLNKVTLIFWMSKEEWVLVETDLTTQRAKWANDEKKRVGSGMKAAEMLSYLEVLFKTKFPKNSLHEVVVSSTPAATE